MRFLSTFGRLPGTWLNLALILVSGLLEGFGIVLFIPLLQSLLSSSDAEQFTATNELTTYIFRIPELLGLPATTLVFLFLIVSLVLGSLLLNYIQRHCLVCSKHRFVLHLRQKILSTYFASEWSFSSRQALGRIVNLLTTESARSGIGIAQELQGVAAGLQILVFLFLSIIISWEMMLVTVPFAAIALTIILPFVRQARSLGEKTKVANEELGASSVDYLKGIKVLRAAGLPSQVLNSVTKLCEALSDANVQAELNTTRIYFIIQSIPVFLIVILIGVGHTYFHLDSAFILGFLLFLSRIAPRIAQFQQYYQSYAITSPAIRAVDSFIDESQAAEEDIHSMGLPFETLENSIDFQNVHFDFEGSPKKVIRGVSLSIQKKQFVAIVGKSGSGKSTALDLLVSLRRPTSGKIMIDGTDIDKYNLVSWRQKVGYVAQEAVLFNDTLRNNLLLFSPDATEKDIQWAIKTSHLDEVIDNLPDGLETLVGENGVRFSGGQKQRIAIARTLVSNPELLVLDEATSALDNESERFIQEALESIRHSMTIVVIAHRLSTVRKADKIYVLEAGSLIEEGDFESLIKADGRFKQLHDLQFK